MLVWDFHAISEVRKRERERTREKKEKQDINAKRYKNFKFEWKLTKNVVNIWQQQRKHQQKLSHAFSFSISVSAACTIFSATQKERKFIICRCKSLIKHYQSCIYVSVTWWWLFFLSNIYPILLLFKQSKNVIQTEFIVILLFLNS